MATSDSTPNTEKTTKHRAGNRQTDSYDTFAMYMDKRIKTRPEHDSILDPTSSCRRCALSYRQMHITEERLQDGLPVDNTYRWHIAYHKQNCGER